MKRFRAFRGRGRWGRGRAALEAPEPSSAVAARRCGRAKHGGATGSSRRCEGSGLHRGMAWPRPARSRARSSSRAAGPACPRESEQPPRLPRPRPPNSTRPAPAAPRSHTHGCRGRHGCPLAPRVPLAPLVALAPSASRAPSQHAPAPPCPFTPQPPPPPTRGGAGADRLSGAMTRTMPASPW